MADYDAGKGRRYQLLFAVNGGAFAIVSLWVDAAGEAASGAGLANEAIFGSLTGWQVGLGMALFNVVMFADICAFGWMQRRVTGGQVFHQPGWVVLICICTLLVSGWMLAMNVAGVGAGTLVVSVLIVLAVLAYCMWWLVGLLPEPQRAPVVTAS